MGTWGHGSFENDGASDWAYDLESHKDLTLIRSALDALRGSDYLESSDAENALGACEVLASLQGRPAANLPDSVTSWVAVNPQPVPDDLRELARAALDRLTSSSNSELYELWEDSGELEPWLANVNELRSRL